MAHGAIIGKKGLSVPNGAKDKTMKGQTLSLSAGAAEEKSHVVNRAAL